MLFEQPCYLGDVLVRRGVLSASCLDSLRKDRAASGGALDFRRLVVGSGAASDEAVAQALAEEAALPYLSGIDAEAVMVDVEV